MTTLPAPFAPLVSGGEGLDRYPSGTAALAARMAEVYGVPADHVLPVRGATHGFELIFRLALREQLDLQAPEAEPFTTLAAIYPTPAETAGTIRIAGRGTNGGDAASCDLLVMDEAAIEFEVNHSVAARVAGTPNLIVVRSLSLAYGLAGARVGALIARPEVLERLRGVLEPYALPEPSVRLALQALDPSRMIETEARIAAVRAERARMVQTLGVNAAAESGPAIRVRGEGLDAAIARLTALGVPVQASDGLCLPVFAKAELNDRTLSAFGVTGAARAARTGEAVRDTKETRIVCAVDLDATGPVRIHTGVGFFDHMLEQVAAHGGFSLRLACEGDLHTDPHHTIEDSAIALGQALKQALGERRGIARYGFVLPMDEANATVSIDLSGRPYPVFEGTFATPFIGDYRTDLTAHVFRSLAEHLGAAIHVSVTGEDDHHKTEAVYKAFGRALRQAIRIEGDAVPSTKGVL
ncbi:MAG: imidazoleglycerol-phosphate dehydratase HisB [Brevundimonas sp.]|uniref:imidazoleglycerol-phosphate dehydratase HisB n=1 Tax=Brevundimonas sp. TaxID=1871086 RepID=UPI0027364C15|nr:imidazoleglycerol-phosphate dehydratase HisB [Brevundimonas sp.]MDP3377639.1 imidazoleglycerol-phosphate dehydratase HisB [Brevundimonas sp.]